MPIKELDDDTIDLVGFGKVRIDEEGVPHAVPDMQFGFDADLGKGCLRPVLMPLSPVI